jgi:TonB family protein
VERRSREADLGSPTGVVGQQMGALFFDPQGADFTRWINHFRREVYRNWLLPQPALLGISGRVRITFQVERDGSLSASYVSGPSGIPAFDRSSANAIRASQLLPLPADFAPARVIMDVVFIYNER